MRTLVFAPANGAAAINIQSQSGPYALISMEGESDTLTEPTGVRSPRQIGQTPTSVRVGGRTITLQVGIIGSTEAERAVYLKALIAAWTDAPPIIGRAPSVGSLSYAQPGRSTYLIGAMPAGGPRETFVDDTREMAIYECDLWCPDPRWMASSSTTVDLQNEFGGFWFPIEFPFSMDAFVTGGYVLNTGNTTSSLVLRMYGEFTTGRIVNDSTGELIEVTGLVDAGDWIEVSTAFGAKYVRLYHPDGSWENALDRYNLETSTFFQLPTGETLLRFEADDLVDGYAEAVFTPAMSGV